MNLKGLSSSQVVENRKKYGENKLPEKKMKTAWEFFFETFKDRLNQILLGMMIVFVILFLLGQGAISEPIGIGAVLLLIAASGTATGLKVQRSAKELKDKTSVHYCNVLRNGVVEHINTKELVIGDIVILQSGEGIYADGYLVEGKIKVDNSVLNGESEDCKKTPIKNYIYDSSKKITGDDYVDQNSLFSGTNITEGEGKMVVTQIGVNTVNGKTIMSIDEIEEVKTSLQIQLDDLADTITKFGYIGAITIVAVMLGSEIFRVGLTNYISQGAMSILQDALTIIVTAITVIVAAVPEGLPLIIKIITSQNSKVMLKNNILAKNTNKIPEAGNIELLCTDKTGTLTKGILVPVHNVDPAGRELSDKELKEFKENIVLNSSAMFDEAGEIVGGNPTERALLSMVTKDEFEQMTRIEVEDKLPFNSKNKYSAVRLCNGLTYYKGAPEKLLSVAKTYKTENGNESLDINKVNEDGEKLSNSEFTLYRNSSLTSVVSKGLSFKGLSPGTTYYLKETKAPSGYQLLGKTLEVKVDSSGKITIPNYEVTSQSGKHQVTIVNQEINVLPNTGGVGIVPFIVVGLVLIIFGIGFVIAMFRKRGDKHEKSRK